MADQYADNKFQIPSRFLKYISKYIFSSEEMQDINQHKYVPVFSQILDLTVAAPTSSPFIVNQPGRAAVIFGIDLSAGAATGVYNPVTNAGTEAVATQAMAFARFNDQNADFIAGIPLKHNRGFIGTFQSLVLTWPAQTNTQARLVIFKWDGHPWQSGEAAT